MPSYEFPAGAGFAHLDLEETGALLPVRLTVPVLRKRYLEAHGLKVDASKYGYALIDTGASTSAVDDRVMKMLEIPVLEEAETMTPHGLGFSNVYNASASFGVLGRLDVTLEGVLGCYLGEPEVGRPEIVMLLGRDLLREFVVTYDGPNARVTIQT